MDTYQIPVEDIVIDPLAMVAAFDTGNTRAHAKTLALIRDEFGVITLAARPTCPSACPTGTR